MSHGIDRPAFPADTERETVEAALRLLGKRNLVLAIQDPSFPGQPGLDIGRGTPYSKAAARFLEFVRGLGFNGILLGPQGQTSRINPSPYDGTVFSKNTLSIALEHLADPDGGPPLLDPDTLAELARRRPPGGERRVPQDYVFVAQRQALLEAYGRFSRLRAGAAPGDPVREMERGLAAFQEKNAAWLDRDALYDALADAYGGHAWMHWPDTPAGRLDQDLWVPPPGGEAASARRREELRQAHAAAIERYGFWQQLVHRQHAGLRRTAGALGLKLIGDLQIGFSVTDTWSWRSCFMKEYFMGAPPSRTNPEGQPWNYPVLNPALYGEAGEPGPALRLVALRLNKMLAEFDGVRIDHPHGLICPWVYRANRLDPLREVQHGARLFCSPDLPDHPELAPLAIARPEQINRRSGLPRHADEWVTALDAGQVRRYSAVLDVIVAEARANGREVRDILCEVLSTMPFPLQAVMDRFGLGRFRVTQKANLREASDVYRTENAAPADWVMVGNHDTPSLWLLLQRWQQAGALAGQADYLAWRLCPPGGDRERLSRQLRASPGLLAQAKFADLFHSVAENVMVFFTDLLGLAETYNAPGTVSALNWSLRVPPDYAAAYAGDRARAAALNLPVALALALRARGLHVSDEQRALLARLDECSGWSRSD